MCFCYLQILPSDIVIYLIIQMYFVLQVKVFNSNLCIQTSGVGQKPPRTKTTRTKTPPDIIPPRTKTTLDKNPLFYL